MNTHLLMAAFVATGLATAIALPASSAIASETCESAMDLGCKMSAGAFFSKQPTKHHSMQPTKHRSWTSSYPLAVPYFDPDWCKGNRGNEGSDIPAYLRGSCNY